MARQLKPAQNGPDQPTVQGGAPQANGQPPAQWQTGSAEFPLRKTGTTTRANSSRRRAYNRGYNHTPVIRVK